MSLLFGRLLAVMCHPLLAWRRLSAAGRVALTLWYASLSYVTTFFTLFALHG